MFDWISIELTSKCNKKCFMCGRSAVRDKMELGDMDFGLFKHIINQYHGSILQFSRDGEPLLYKHFEDLSNYMWYKQESKLVSNIVTNGILLNEMKHLIYDSFTTITVSVIENDVEQMENIIKFYNYISHPNPIVYIKFLGDYYNPEFEKLGFKTMRRVIHNPQGDWDYQGQGKELIPEVGVCMDFLNKPSINWKGEFFICNRFDPDKKGKIGDVTKQSLKEIWDSDIRNEWLEYHKKGRRDKIPLCKDCQFWGIPRYI